MPISADAAGHFRNFTVSVYARVYELRQMGDLCSYPTDVLTQIRNCIGCLG